MDTESKRRRSWMAVLVLVALAWTLLAACGRDEATPTSTPEAAAAEAAPAEAAPAEAATPTPAPAGAATPAPAADAGAPAAEEPAGAAALEPGQRNGMYDAPPEMTIDPSKYYYATIKTEKGDVKIQLFADRAPVTVNNFVYLAQQGFYDNTSFHRVLEDFMAQGGDPTGTGTGGPGYVFQDEFFPGLEFDRPYLLAMANAGPGTNGSQFFITFEPTPHLNNLHTIFGEVIEGQDVVDAITRRDPGSSTPGDTILSIEIEESDESVLPTPTPGPPTPTPTNTPTPFPPSALEAEGRPLAEMPVEQRAAYFNAPPEMTIDTANTYTATVATSKGDLTIKLFDDDAPVAVNNFVVLADRGFFDQAPINQINPNTLFVFGLPDGMSDVGYDIIPEIGLPSAPITGSLAYAPKSASPEGIVTSGSLLLMALTPPPAESSVQYSFFGQVVDGLEILPTLAQTDTIESVTIEVEEK